MERNLANLSKHVYDLLVIGGGIYGVCVAWDAVLRGLSVALIEKGDWGHATSANSLRVIHGGLRYLQHGDIRRTWQSIRERAAFMRIAPHLVKPLPILIPTYGHGLRSKEVFAIALSMENFLRSGQDFTDGEAGHLPKGRFVSKEELYRLIPQIEAEGLTGGVIIHDCQMYSSERVVIAVAQSAAQAGAQMANYVAATHFITKGNRVTGVEAKDLLSGDAFTIHSRLTINATGPWLEDTFGLLNRQRPHRKLMYSKAFNILVNRQIFSTVAVGLYSRNLFRDSDALLKKGARLLFIMPWQGGSLIGTAHHSHRGHSDNITVSEEELQLLLDEVNNAYPAAYLARHDVSYIYAGLLPARNREDDEIQLVKRYQIHDHQKQDGVAGLLSINGVKFTEARYVAEKTVNVALKKLEKPLKSSATTVTPLYGAKIPDAEWFQSLEVQSKSLGLEPQAVRQLFLLYGSAYSDVLTHLDTAPASIQNGSSDVALLRAQIRYGIHKEMAQTLADIVFRRLILARSGHPGAAHLRICASIMSQELGWSLTKTEEEIKNVEAILRSHYAIESSPERERFRRWREERYDAEHAMAISHV